MNIGISFYSVHGKGRGFPSESAEFFPTARLMKRRPIVIFANTSEAYQPPKQRTFALGESIEIIPAFESADAVQMQAAAQFTIPTSCGGRCDQMWGGPLLKNALRGDAAWLRALLRPCALKLFGLLAYAEATAVPLGKGRAVGWSSGHRTNMPFAESWATAAVFWLYEFSHEGTVTFGHQHTSAARKARHRRKSTAQRRK